MGMQMRGHYMFELHCLYWTGHISYSQGDTNTNTSSHVHWRCWIKSVHRPNKSRLLRN